jgi:ABC-type cobalt transport system substrate-binding protein
MSKKNIFVLLIVFFIVALVFIIIFWAKPLYQGWKINQEAQKFVDDYTKPLKEDNYGGKTPEETWDMFMNALKKGDTDLAAKYFEVKEQAETKEWLAEVKRENMLETMIKDLIANNLNESRKDESIAEYTISDKKNKKIIASITFIKNIFTNIWKISSL